MRRDEHRPSTTIAITMGIVSHAAAAAAAARVAVAGCVVWELLNGRSSAAHLAGFYCRLSGFPFVRLPV